MDPNAMRIAELVRKLHAVPEKLVTAQLYLRPLHQSGPIATPTETIQPIANACDLMHSALSDVVEVAHNLAELSGADQSGQVFHRVSVDSYYRRGP